VLTETGQSVPEVGSIVKKLTWGVILKLN
jgi:hypothetical protein